MGRSLQICSAATVTGCSWESVSAALPVPVLPEVQGLHGAVTGGCRTVNMSPVLDSTSLSEREEMWDESSPAETTKPEPDLGSQETPLTQNRTTRVPIPPQGGESCTICPTGLLSGLEPRAHRWAAPSVVLNLILTILIIVLIIIIFTMALPAKRSEPCPACAACPDSWIKYLGKCYYFSQAEGNWTFSQSNCSALGASLAVIDTQQEMVFLMRYKGDYDHWIGLWREPDQPWMWTNGTEFNNWFPIAGGGLCAFANHDGIASSGCSRDAHWICNKPVEKPEGRVKRL